MSHWKGTKPEHCGAKHGKGIGRKKEVKQAARVIRRRTKKKEINEGLKEI